MLRSEDSRLDGGRRLLFSQFFSQNYTITVPVSTYILTTIIPQFLRYLLLFPYYFIIS